MNRSNFPLIALALSVPLLMFLVYGAQRAPDGSMVLPLLTLLAISEFGAIANAIAAWLRIGPMLQGQFDARGAVIGAASMLFTAAFTWYLVSLWPF
ncbi:MAG: hypothetical protein WBG92_13540 [Thiohalocapsa sp.]